MTPKVWSGSASLACAALVAILGFASTACARDAHWAGLNGQDWNVGLNPDRTASNWFRDRAGLVPGPVPNGTAFFAGNAAAFLSPVITDRAEIGKIRVDSDAARFDVSVQPEGRFIVNGAGIINYSANTPTFHVSGRMEFHGSARLVPVGARSADFSLTGHGQLRFSGASKGGDARVEILDPVALVLFAHEASAAKMAITNRFGSVTFRDRSTGGDAELINHRDGDVSFLSAGPVQEGTVTIGMIRNDGFLRIGFGTSLVVRRDFVLDTFAQGVVILDIRATDHGNVSVLGQTRLGGNLVVRANAGVVAGRYRLIAAKGGLTGRFGTRQFTGFPANLRPRIQYQRSAVDLIVE